MPLLFADIGTEHIIQRVGGIPAVRKHLENLGFVPGSKVTVLAAADGNVIVRVRDTRVAPSLPLLTQLNKKNLILQGLIVTSNYFVAEKGLSVNSVF